MRPPQTLFVVGAGASSEAGLPIGTELVEIIARRLDYQLKGAFLDSDSGDKDILDFLQSIAPTREGIELYLRAAKGIRDGVGFSNSIDSFIDVHREDEQIQLCGKLAISKSILESERNSKLFIDERTKQFTDPEGLKDTWFLRFFRHLNDGIRKSEIDRIFDKVSFVVFNYDRCVEHFMYHALQLHFGISPPDAANITKRLRIFHPYGTIAELPWQNHQEGVPFGFLANRANLALMASRIKTYTEQIGDDDFLKEIHEQIVSADTLVFLGFSYHAQNMRLLAPGARCATTQIFGTAVGISENNKDIILEEIRSLIGKSLRQDRLRDGIHPCVWEPIHVRELGCSRLIEEFSRSLFAAGPP
jgi:hypothetical protein